MDWLTFGASIATTIATLLLGALGIRHQLRQERTKQIQAEAGVRQDDRDHYAQREKDFWARAEGEIARLRKELETERLARQDDNVRLGKFIGDLQRELIEERAARLRDAADNESRINALVYQVRVLREENDELKKLLTEHGITLEE
jgi:hypothetical protein